MDFNGCGILDDDFVMILTTTCYIECTTMPNDRLGLATDVSASRRTIVLAGIQYDQPLKI
jgi:hypothetical protein